MHLLYGLFPPSSQGPPRGKESLLFCSLVPTGWPDAWLSASVSLDTGHSLTFPVCPFRFKTFSRLVVEKMWITFPLAAANRWPPLLKEDYKEIREERRTKVEQPLWRLSSRAPLPKEFRLKPCVALGTGER